MIVGFLRSKQGHHQKKPFLESILGVCLTRTAWVWSMWLSRFKKRMKGGDRPYNRPHVMIQVHFAHLMSSQWTQYAWVSVPLIDNGVLLLGGTEITGEMMTLKSAGDKYTIRNTIRQSVLYVHQNIHSCDKTCWKTWNQPIAAAKYTSKDFLDTGAGLKIKSSI